MNLKKDTESFAQAINTATVTAKDKAIGDATSYLSSHNDTLLDKMERVFACNMQLMEDEKDEFNVDDAAQHAIKQFLTPATTTTMVKTNSPECGPGKLYSIWCIGFHDGFGFSFFIFFCFANFFKYLFFS